MRNRVCLFACVTTVLLSTLTAVHAQTGEVTDDDVDELIDHMVDTIRQKQRRFDVIRINGPIRLTSTGEVIDRQAKRYRGKIIRREGNRTVFETQDGMRFEVEDRYVLQIDVSGHMDGEKTNLYSHGGRTALAVYALLSAGLSRHDQSVRAGLQYLEHHPMPGTYGRALRASIYSMLVQKSSAPDEKERLLKLLRRDARWLVLAMNDSGGYTYFSIEDQGNRARPMRRYDNSNTQFGNLGVWISSLGGYQVKPAYWLKVAQHWMSMQNEDGGWGYRASVPSTQNMTIAGINSLILVLDQLYAKSKGRYVRFEGIARNKRTQDEIDELNRTIARGLHYLATHAKPYGEAYTQLGLERLGLASGQKYIGSSDWYRAGAQRAMELSNWESKSIERISMWLLFLAYGRAPVLINKLKWGGDDSGWDYYFRDIYHVCRYLSNRYEQVYKWQIIDTASSKEDFDDAPLLYISGGSRFWLPAGTQARIRDYVYGGGTIIGHTNRGNADFTGSFKSFFEALFSDLGTSFRKLPADHPLYVAAGVHDNGPSTRVPVWSLSDGYREIVMLIPVDVAGAWHQALDEEYPDFFRWMADVRFYAARRYADLPGRLRRNRFATAPAQPLGKLRVARALTAADRGGAPHVWGTMDRFMAHFYGIQIEPVNTVRLDAVDQTSGFELVHIAGQGDYEFTTAELQALKRYCESGGSVLVEALGGDEHFAAAASGQLAELFGESFKQLDDQARTIAGNFERGRRLSDLTYTLAARRGHQRADLPPLYGVQVDQRTELVFSPLDLSVSASGAFVKGLRGYDVHSARQILRNVVLERFSDLYHEHNSQIPK